MRRLGIVLGLAAVAVLVWLWSTQEAEAPTPVEPDTSTLADDSGPVLLPGEPGGKEAVETRFKPVVERGIRFDVRMPDGSQAKRATLRFAKKRRAAFGGTSIGWMPGLDSVQPPPDTRYVVAEHEGMYSDAVRVKKKGQQTISLEASRGGELVGKVHAPAGVTYDDVEVLAYLFKGATPEPPSAMTLRSGLLNTSYGKYDRKTRTFRFKKLAPGSYWVCAGASVGAPVDAAEVVQIEDRLVQQDLTLRPAPRASSVTLKVHGPDGALIRDKKLQVMVKYTAPDTFSTGSATVRNDDGDYVIATDGKVERRGGQPSQRGVYRISVTKEGLGTRQLQIDEGHSGDLALRFDTPTEVHLQLQDVPASIREFCKVALQIPMRGSMGVSYGSYGGGATTAKVDAEGRAHFPLVQPDVYELRLMYYNPAQASVIIDIERVPLEVTASDNRHTIRIPKLHSVSVNGAGTVSLGLARVDRLGLWNHQYNTSGSEEIGPRILQFVPPGDYELRWRVSRHDERSIKFSVPDQLSVDLK